MATEIVDRIKLASSRHAELQRMLVDTGNAKQMQNEQIELIADLEGQITESSRTLKNLDNKRVVELGDHVKYRDSFVRRLVYKGSGQGDRFLAKKAKEEREYMEVLQRLQEAETARDGLQQHLKDAKRRKNEAETLHDLHQSTRRELESFYGSFFSAPTPAFSQEGKLKEDADYALQAYHDALMRQEEDSHRVDLLELGVAKCQLAVRRMRDACDYSRGDILGMDYLNTMASSSLELAISNIQEARDFAAQANLEGATLPGFSMGQSDLMDDSLFDSIFADVKYHKQIKAGYAEAQRFYETYWQRLQAMKKRLEVSDRDLKDREKEMDGSRDELQAERARIFEAVVRGEITG